MGDDYSLSIWLVSWMDIFRFIKDKNTTFSLVLGTGEYESVCPDEHLPRDHLCASGMLLY